MNRALEIASRGGLVIASAAAVLAVGGCRPTFTVSADELGPYRVVAMGVSDVGGECPVADAFVWSGEGRLHRDSVTLSWSLDGERIGEGWEIEVCGEGELSLVATNAIGERSEGRVSVGAARRPLSVSREAVVLEELDLEARRSVEGEEVYGSVAEGEVVRASVDLEVELLRSRWISEPGQGSVLDVEWGVGDLFGEELLFEDGALVESEALGVGVFSHLFVGVDGEGGNSWGWVDAAYGVVEATLLRHRGWLFAPDFSSSELLSAADVTPGELVAMSLDVVDGEVTFGELEVVEDLEQQEIACGREGAAFELDWLTSGRCTISEIEGSRVVVELW